MSGSRLVPPTVLQLPTSAAARIWGPEPQLRVMQHQQEGKRREPAKREPKSIHCPQDSLTFLLSELGLGLRECITLNVFPSSLDARP